MGFLYFNNLNKNSKFIILSLFLLIFVFGVIADDFFTDSQSWRFKNGVVFTFNAPIGGNGPQKNVNDNLANVANLGAVFAAGNGSDIGFQIFYEGNFSNSTFCVNSGFNSTLMIFIDGDKNPQTGCNLFGDPANCLPGANNRILMNGTNNLTVLQFWNSTSNAFENNVSSVYVDLSSGCARAFNPYILRLGTLQSNLGLSPNTVNGSINLAAKITSTYPNLTIIDEILPGFGGGGGGCHKYDKNQIGCQNDSINLGLKCSWKSNFNACDDDFSNIQDCDHFAGICRDQTNCTVGTQYRPPGTWDSGVSKCREPFFGNVISSCSNDCMGCFAQTSCEQSGQGSAGNCQWKTVDPAVNRSECRPANEKVCSSAYPTLCNNPQMCNTITTSVANNFSWSNILNVCLPFNMTNGTVAYGNANFKEICFNGIDDNSDGKADCSDLTCFNSSIGADAWKNADPSCGGGFNPLNLGYNIGGGFNPEMFKNDLLSSGGADGPPVIIGQDPVNDTVVSNINATELDILGLGVKDMNTAFGFGIMTQTNRFASQCHPYNGIQGNMTQRFFFVADSDNNLSTGCNVTYNLFSASATNLSGIDYLYYYSINETNGTETKVGYQCMNISGTYKMILLPVSLSGISNNMKPFTCNFMDGGVQSGASILVVPKNGIGKGLASSLKTPLKLNVFTGNISTVLLSSDGLQVPMTITGLGNATDSLLESYYTPGTADFKPVDCFANPTSCGSSFAIDGGGKFFKFEDCVKPGDEDNNGLSDCADPICSFAPNCKNSGSLYNASADKTSPSILSVRAETQKDGAFLIVQTSKPTNLTVNFYDRNSSCISTPKLLYDLGNPEFTGDDYRPFHGLGLFNGSIVPQGNGSTISLNTTNDTAYFYKLTAFAQNGLKASSSCLNFTTAASTQDKLVSFRPIFNTDSGNSHTSSMSFKVKYPNGTVASTITTNSSSSTTNVTVLTNATIDITGADGTGISLVGANLAKAAEINLTGAFNIKSPNSTYGYVSMNSSKWNEISQALGVSTVLITVPGTENKLLHCDDDGLTNCTDVTSESGVSRLSVDTNAGTAVWKVPSTIGFSSYASTTAVSSSSSSSSSSSGSGGGGASNTVIVNPILSSLTSTTGTFTLSDLTDSVKDALANKFSFSFNCAVPPCKVTAKEFVVSSLSADITNYISTKGEVLGVVDLVCSGTVDTGSSTFTVPNCEGVGVSVIHTDGSKEDAVVTCASGKVKATWNKGCSYIVVWKKNNQQTQEAKQSNVETQQQVEATQAQPQNKNNRKLSLILLIGLGVVVLIVVLFLLFRKKK